MELVSKLQAFVRDNLKQVDELILEHARAANEQLVEEVAGYLINSGGKRIRPILTLLSANLFEYKGRNSVLLASAIEFIHAATLLHDDVIDESDMRRSKPTANVVWGNKTSILVGDYLFSQSFKLMVQTKNLDALEILSVASSLIVEGELMQLVALKEHKTLSVEKYLQIVHAKTATLFSAASEVGALISDRHECREPLNQYGMLLGIIFQIADDMLDYSASAEEIGKNIGDDFFEGKVTLPIILLMQSMDSANDDEFAKAQNLFFSENKSFEDLQYIQTLMTQYSINTKIDKIIQSKSTEAIACLEGVSNINLQAKELMTELVYFAGQRSK